MDKPRVLLAGHLAPPLGGIATFCRDLLESRLRELVELDFVQTSARGRDLAATGTANLRNIAGAVKDLGRFARAYAGSRPAIAHICTAVGASFLKNGLCVVWARLKGGRVVLHPHCSFDRLYAGPRLWKWYCRRIFRLSSAVIVLSKEWDALRDLLPGLEIRYLPNAIDLRPYRALAGKRQPPDDRPLRILYLGHLGAAKGTFDLLEAFRALDPAGRRLELELVGDVLDVREEARLAAAVAADPGAGKRTIRVPPVSGRDKWDSFGRADIFVFPSHAEGMPLTVLEAMASGLPVVAAAVGGIPELVTEGETGLLIPPGDPARLAGALGRLVSDAALRSGMGRRGLDLAGDHDMDVYAGDLAAIYGAIIAKNAT